MREVRWGAVLPVLDSVLAGGGSGYPDLGHGGELTEHESVNRCPEHLSETGPFVVLSTGHATLTDGRRSVRGRASSPFADYASRIDDGSRDVLWGAYLGDGSPVS